MKRVVLVRPSGPRNVGMIVRAAANFGPCELVLVAPERPSLLVHPEFSQMAHGVAEPELRCTIVASLREALSDCTGSFGFSARTREQRPRVDWRAIRGAATARANDSAERIAFVFGNEVGGLTAAEASELAELVHIATSAEHTSINLALAVGIVLADLFAEPGARRRERHAKVLSGEGREYLKASLKHVLADKIARGAVRPARRPRVDRARVLARPARGPRCARVAPRVAGARQRADAQGPRSAAGAETRAAQGGGREEARAGGVDRRWGRVTSATRESELGRGRPRGGRGRWGGRCPTSDSAAALPPAEDGRR